MSVWILPDHIADVLPAQARQIEELRRSLLDTACSYGYELVIPPAMEYLTSLLTGTGSDLNLQTFKLVDQLSGRSMGLRADTTPQVARIDAHLLGRPGVARLCYCGSVFHTKPAKPSATREPLQLGAELYGYAGVEADIEIVLLALDCLKRAGVANITLDLAEVGLVDDLMELTQLPEDRVKQLNAALEMKDLSQLQVLLADVAEPARSLIAGLSKTFGGLEVLEQAEQKFAAHPSLVLRLQRMRQVAASVQAAHPDVTLLIDLADNQGWSYYNGLRFAAYAAQSGQVVLRGGRYDGVGAVFGHQTGRDRPAVGFSLDLKELTAAVAPSPLRKAIQTVWQNDANWQAAVAQLRTAGETVVCTMPGTEHEAQEFDCDRELKLQNGAWQVHAV